MEAAFDPDPSRKRNTDELGNLPPTPEKTGLGTPVTCPMNLSCIVPPSPRLHRPGSETAASQRPTPKFPFTPPPAQLRPSVPAPLLLRQQARSSQLSRPVRFISSAPRSTDSVRAPTCITCAVCREPASAPRTMYSVHGVQHRWTVQHVSEAGGNTPHLDLP